MRIGNNIRSLISTILPNTDGSRFFRVGRYCASFLQDVNLRLVSATAFANHIKIAKEEYQRQNQLDDDQFNEKSGS